MLNGEILYLISIFISLIVLSFTPRPFWSTHKLILFGLIGIIILAILFLFLIPKDKINKLNPWSSNSESDEVVKPVELKPDPILDQKFHDYSGEKTTIQIKTKKGKFVSGKVEYRNFYLELQDKVHDDQFIKGYLSSIKRNLEIKKIKYENLLVVKQKELNNLKDKYPGTGPIHNPKDENSQNVKNLISEIKKILAIINKRCEILDEKTVRDNLLCILENPSGLKKIAGREDVRQHVCKQVLAFSRKPEVFISGFQNILIDGKAGVGKTTVAEVIGYCYSKAGFLCRDIFMKITKTELTTAYVDQSSDKTRNLLYSGLEGIIFCDEIHSITPGNILAVGHGKEALSEIVNFLDKMIGTCVFIAAGYDDEIYRFLDADQGLARRFPYKLHLTEYSASDLTRIFCSKIPIDVPLNTDLLYTCVEYGIKNKCFENQAGDMLNIGNKFLTEFYSIDDVNKSEKVLLGSFNEFFSEHDFYLEA